MAKTKTKPNQHRNSKGDKKKSIRKKAETEGNQTGECGKMNENAKELIKVTYRAKRI